MTRLTDIWRHPIKSIGREALDRITLEPDAWLPGDRLWAVPHEKAAFEGAADSWQRCGNFLRCANGPGLMAITATARPREDGLLEVTLNHPETDSLRVAPDAPGAFDALKTWLGAIWPADMPAPTGIYRNAGGSLTDNSAPLLAIHNHASHRAVEERVGKPLSILRWRGNLWLDGLGPWQEFEWIGKEIRIGGAVLKVEDRITRCKATMANPETGQRDADTLKALETWDHRDFGVLARVIQGGEIAKGDPVQVPV